MLLTQDARDLHEAVSERWKHLRAWMNDPANTTAAKSISPSISGLYSHWVTVDHGITSNTDDIDSAHKELETAETYAIEVGYPTPDGYHKRTATTVDIHLGGTAPYAEKLEEYCVAHPGDILCKASVPQDKAWCQRLGVPGLVCDDGGLKDWFLWAVGGAGVLGVVGIAYAAYKAAEVVAPIAVPLAMSVYAPGALPAYNAAMQSRQQRQTPVAPHVARLMGEV